jgi:hypothetical protein
MTTAEKQKAAPKVLSYGAGVNSTAILALIAEGKITNVSEAVFADTGAERRCTYDYLAYIQKRSPIPIVVVRSKEGSLWDYCERKVVLPARYMRWCTDRWKRKPLHDYVEGATHVIGIHAGESQRVNRWKSKAGFEFPLISLGIDQAGCIAAIERQGWKVPEKSGCVFCPFAKTAEFARLKQDEPATFERLCRLEAAAMRRLGNRGTAGWFGKFPLDELVARKHPETVEGQMCLYCMEE